MAKVLKRSVFLRELLDPDLLKRRMRFCAMYDAIAAPGFRSFQFHPKWRPGEQMGAFKNGSGDFFFAWFAAKNKGAVIRGFAHEREPQAAADVFEGLPPRFAYVLKEPAFAQDELTFAVWHTGRGSWSASDALRPLHNGAAELLGCLDRNFEKWRRRYYATNRSKAIEVLWWDQPITREVVGALNPDADLDVVRKEAKLLAWPLDLDDSKTKKRSSAKAKLTSDFGEAEFVVRCEPTRVRMLIHGTRVVAEAKVDMYGALFDLVKARIVEAKRKGA